MGLVVHGSPPGMIPELEIKKNYESLVTYRTHEGIINIEAIFLATFVCLGYREFQFTVIAGYLERYGGIARD